MFGLPYIIAPQEAEAQCAWLDEQGLVDGVVTDDADALVFGAQRVYRWGRVGWGGRVQGAGDGWGRGQTAAELAEGGPWGPPCCCCRRLLLPAGRHVSSACGQPLSAAAR